MYPNLLGKINMTEAKIKVQIRKDIPKIIKFIPDENIIISHDENNRRVCPKSGWITKRNKTINNKINV